MRLRATFPSYPTRWHATRARCQIEPFRQGETCLRELRGTDGAPCRGRTLNFRTTPRTVDDGVFRRVDGMALENRPLSSAVSHGGRARSRKDRLECVRPVSKPFEQAQGSQAVFCDRVHRQDRRVNALLLRSVCILSLGGWVSELEILDGRHRLTAGNSGHAHGAIGFFDRVVALDFRRRRTSTCRIRDWTVDFPLLPCRSNCALRGHSRA